MKEIWRSIKDYEGLYEVSSWGRVRSLKRGKFLKLQISCWGYLRVELNKNGKGIKHSVHRLVTEAFIPNPNNYPQVNHKDENKLNNHADNLEWCQPEYNNNYGTHNERVAKAKSKTVYMLTLDGGLCGMWPSTQECARNGFNQSHVAECCNGKLKKYKGFKWSYEPPKPLGMIEYKY